MKTLALALALAALLPAKSFADSAPLARADIAVFCDNGQAVIPPGLLAHVSNDGLAYHVDYSVPANEAALQILIKQPTHALWLKVLKSNSDDDYNAMLSYLSGLCAQS